jgi:hypothetical protein
MESLTSKSGAASSASPCDKSENVPNLISRGYGWHPRPSQLAFSLCFVQLFRLQNNMLQQHVSIAKKGLVSHKYALNRQSEHRMCRVDGKCYLQRSCRMVGLSSFKMNSDDKPVCVCTGIRVCAICEPVRLKTVGLADASGRNTRQAWFRYCRTCNIAWRTPQDSGSLDKVCSCEPPPPPTCKAPCWILKIMVGCRISSAADYAK